MKKFLREMMLIVFCLFVVGMNVNACAQANASNATCSKPLVLGLALSGNGGTEYELSGKVYAGYPLDDLRRQLSGCKVSRPLHVVIDSRVPIGQISSAVAPKLQLDNVRYFIRYPASEHLVIEIKIGDYLPKLP